MTPAPERPDPVPPYHDDRGDLQEAWVRGYHAAEAAAPVTDAGLREAALYAIAVYDRTHLRHDVAYETVADALENLRAALSRQAEKEMA